MSQDPFHFPVMKLIICSMFEIGAHTSVGGAVPLEHIKCLPLCLNEEALSLGLEDCSSPSSVIVDNVLLSLRELVTPLLYSRELPLSLKFDRLHSTVLAELARSLGQDGSNPTNILTSINS